ncbi:MAG: hypothetical protein JRJ20_10810 [Deltaproteobacteria bacterium]|nr:hypothetical protein [Deltaproteobacteria bacterium]
METATSVNHRITVISNSNFETEVLCTEKPVLLMCMLQGQEYSEQIRVLKQVLETYDGLIGMRRLEEDFINGFKQMYSIKGTPVFLLFHEGKEKGRMLGMADRERLEAFLTQNLPQCSLETRMEPLAQT